MYDTGGNHGVCRRQQVDKELGMRLQRLNAVLARDAELEFRTRLAFIEQRVHPFAEPVSTQEAVARFGALLGVLPSAAIFLRLLWNVTDTAAFYWLLILAAIMNLICYRVGRAAAVKLGPALERAEDYPWASRLVMPALIGLLWGLITGAAGGFLFFGIGAIFGAVAAAAVGAFGFTLFASLHRMLARGGMIEARHFRPLAYGVNGLIAGLIFFI